MDGVSALTGRRARLARAYAMARVHRALGVVFLTIQTDCIRCTLTAVLIWTSAPDTGKIPVSVWRS